MKRKKSYSEKNPTKLLWPMSAKSDQKNLFIQKEKKNRKLAWPMSGKSDT